MGMLIVLAALLGAPPGTTLDESMPVVSKDENHFSQRFARGKETLRVDVWRRPFRRERHHLKLSGDQVETVDGRSPLGTDGGPPEALRTEIARVRVGWGGTTVEVPKELFQDCFNGSLSTGVMVKPSDDFASVMIRLSGGDGAGAYEAYLIASRDGFSTRFLAEEGGL
jgi:hypothetical protein